MTKVSQVAHGFEVGQVVRFNFAGPAWALAQATNRSLVRGIVRRVLGANRFDVITKGAARIQDHGFTVGSVLYISGDTAGELDEAAPATGQTDPIAIVTDPATIEVIPAGAGAIMYRRAFVNGDLASNILTVTHNLGRRFNSVEIYDGNNNLWNMNLSLTDLLAINENSLSINFTGFTPLSGTWNVVVIG